ncbi:UNVERIFIED_CONTAM: hypothetical protein GTU68_045571, partial [Idotea baltica]|nr:hypothetical protein [Idotea baltica]
AVVAVKGISFHVKKGECFGLLGVNGAGKTTTFRMLTGDEVRSSGDARIGNNYLSHGRKQFMEEIGYCPQFDAIIGELTGEEMLSLMAGLRGVSRKRQPQLLERLIKLVDLTECAKRPSSTYSGGNKRKLSTAMALVGQPPLVFLDEPTSGVDPASRRRVWEAVRDATRAGQSVILTSHSMDECEALCSNVVIMAKGVLKCSGTPKHLKAKFGKGYTLQIKIKSSLPQQLQHSLSEDQKEAAYVDMIAGLKEIISQGFEGSTLTDEHRVKFLFFFSLMSALYCN